MMGDITKVLNENSQPGETFIYKGAEATLLNP